MGSIVELAVGLNDRDSAIATAPLKFMHQTRKDSVVPDGLHWFIVSSLRLIACKLFAVAIANLVQPLAHFDWNS